jgi:hypothetical protein
MVLRISMISPVGKLVKTPLPVLGAVRKFKVLAVTFPCAIGLISLKIKKVKKVTKLEPNN